MAANKQDTALYRRPFSQEKNDVEKMNIMFETSYTDPFNLEDPPKQLIYFATGVIAREDIQIYMLGCINKGREIVTMFLEERLITDQNQVFPQKSFYYCVPRSGVKAMADKLLFM